jgi:hypothetical protein
MHVRFSEGQLGDELAEFFRRNDCLVERVGERVLEINPRLPLLPEAAKLEVEGLLRVWSRLHPDSSIALLGEEQLPERPGLPTS